MAFKMDVQAVKDFKEKLYPKGPYEGQIVAVEEKTASSGREFFALQVKILETIPAEQEIDEEEFLNPLGKTVFYNVMTPMHDTDKPGTISMFQKNLSNMLKFGNIDPAVEGELSGDDLLNQYVGVIMSHNKINKDNPKSDLRAELTGFCPMPE